jgi:hypothetical protein
MNPNPDAKRSRLRSNSSVDSFIISKPSGFVNTIVDGPWLLCLQWMKRRSMIGEDRLCRLGGPQLDWRPAPRFRSVPLGGGVRYDAQDVFGLPQAE